MHKSLERFRVIIEDGEDGYLVARVPALPGCVTQARTHEQLLRRIQEAITLSVEHTRRRGSHRRSRRLRGHEPRFFAVEDVDVRV